MGKNVYLKTLLPVFFSHTSFFRDWEIEVLEEKIENYLDLRMKLCADHVELGSVKPKHHFLVHIAQMISQIKSIVYCFF